MNQVFGGSIGPYTVGALRVQRPFKGARDLGYGWAGDLPGGLQR